MGALIKLLIGVVLLVVPLGLYSYEVMNNMQGLFGLTLMRSLGIVLQGMIPGLVMLIGLFVVWLELDEWRIEKELKKEEKKEEVKVKTAKPIAKKKTEKKKKPIKKKK
ncbi:MAG: hypothetical protein ISS48_00855 [Candidatus Aenigmarchaeota archaeon]|nr:hypothetical protein [Candidatus Aenigmarchaeota archaeon]